MTPRPLNLPKFIFLMSNDEASRSLACSVADAMQQVDHTVFIDDFTAPVYNAFMAMFDRNFAKDYGDPKDTSALMLEAEVEKTEHDCIASLVEWFHREFGSSTLGKIAVSRALNQLALADYIYVFRDGQPVYVDMFRQSPLVHSRDTLTVWLHAAPHLTPNGSRHLYLTSPCPTDVAQIISDMEEEAR